MIVDGLQNLRERQIVPLRKEIAQRVGFTGIERRSGNVERPVFAQLQVCICDCMLIGCLILGVNERLSLTRVWHLKLTHLV